MDHGLQETKQKVVMYPHRLDILESLVGKQMGTLAEVGVLDGDFSQTLYNKFTGGELHLIDPWFYQPHLSDDCTNVSDDQQEIRYQAVKIRFHDCRDIKIHRMTGINFMRSDWVPSRKFDFVYLDGDHTYETILQELTLYTSHLRRGGYIMLDDYVTGQYYGTIPAVQAFIQQHTDFKIIAMSEAANANVLLQRDWEIK